MTQAYAPLTPPYYGSPPYQGCVPTMEGSSPPNPTSASMVTSTYLMTSNVINAGRSGKPTRPFKAYPKDPLALSSFQDSTEEYIEFRQRMLAQLELVSGRNNSNMRRSNSPQQPSSTAELDDKTAAYWERRRKNNEAAKRSRDARRAKEDEIAIRAAFLEQENLKLKYELATLRTETAKLRQLVCNR
ncbi:protein giant-like [Macrosteles quadrilineatus]|uniref:protein giant-like n=1 Tax=Macrosteles quadrilineatus TaxID=74068 RepID=UPI0023E2CFBB|nr:protein giant-like [Macrosteles quadrilineatus]